MDQIVFITGINGFAGSYLAEHLVAEGLEVTGLVRPESAVDNLDRVKSDLELHRGDLLERERLTEILASVQPELVFHLAAFSNISASHSVPDRVLRNNIIGQSNLFESLRELELQPRVLVVGSCAEYGQKSGRSKLEETAPFAPRSPYAVSKVTQDVMGSRYYLSHDLPVVRVRPFNHTGPRRPAAYVFSSFARQLAEIEAGGRPPRLETGDLDVQRDYTDVRDVVRGYRLLLDQGAAGEVYNLCRGRAYRIGDLLDHLLSLCEKDVEVRRDPDRLRDNDLEYLAGDNSRLRAATGWQPEIEIEQTLADLLNYWRGNLSESG